MTANNDTVQASLAALKRASDEALGRIAADPQKPQTPDAAPLPPLADIARSLRRIADHLTGQESA